MTHRVGSGPTSAEQALTVECPDCGATPGEPCVYMPVAGYEPGPVDHDRPPRAVVARVGTPTERPHNGRRRAFRPPPPPAPPATTVRVPLTTSQVRILLAITEEWAETAHDIDEGHYPSPPSERWDLEQLARHILPKALWRLTGEWDES